VRGLDRFRRPPAELRRFARTVPDQYRQIFLREAFRFDTDDPQPRLIDAGANLGLVSLYWKRLYPGARITAIEADPNLCEAVAVNVPGIDIVEAALWTDRAGLRFWSEGSDAGRLDAYGSPIEGAKAIDVATVPLSDFLTEPVAMLKMDIEGAEAVVLAAAEPWLANVDRIALEFHSVDEEPQRLHELLALFERNGYRYFVQEEMRVRRPFVDSRLTGCFDNQLLVFADRR